MAGLDIRGVLADHEGQDYDLYAQTINPQFVKMLRTIGYDRLWSRAEGAYIFDSDGRRFLDMNGGFGMFNAGRNNPRIRPGAPQDVLDLRHARLRAARREPPPPASSAASSRSGARADRAPACSPTRERKPSRRRSSSAGPPPAARVSSPRARASTASRSARCPQTAGLNGRSASARSFPGSTRCPGTTWTRSRTS